MKHKAKIIIPLLTLALLLSACGIGGKTRSFEYEETGIKETIAYTYKDDKILSQKSEATMSYEALGISAEDAELFTDLFEDEFTETEGVKVTTQSNEADLILTLEVDFKKAEENTLLELIDSITEDDINNGVSMEETADRLLDAGYIEK